MKKFFIILIAFLGLFLVLGGILFFQKNVFLISNASLNKNFNNDFTLLLLGKPGPGYIGSENTDSLVVLYYQAKTNKIFLIPIPRDLIVKDKNGDLEKINALFEKGKIDLLLSKVSAYTGLEVKNYLAVDLKLILDLVDFLGGIEINLDEPVVDAASLYTIPAGRQTLNSDLVELVLRSRYHPTGDFFRVKNQMKVLIALKEKISQLEADKKLALMKFLEKEKYYWQTNLNKNDLLNLALKFNDLKNLEIIPLTLEWPNPYLTSDYFYLYNTENVYGIIPTKGIDNYEELRLYFRSQIWQN